MTRSIFRSGAFPASDLNKRIYGTIEAWRNRAIEGEHPYVYLDGIVLKRSWAGECVMFPCWLRFARLLAWGSA